jgi:hypothetical protein
MKLFEAQMKAMHDRCFQVYREKYPGIHRGIHTEFTQEERNSTDWQVVKWTESYVHSNEQAMRTIPRELTGIPLL